MIRNLSKEYEISVWYIQVGGAKFELKPTVKKRIAAGETGYITLPEHLLADCTNPFDITVVYTLYNNQAQLKSKTFTFTPLSAADVAQYSYLITAAPISTEITDLGRPEKTTNTEKPTDEPTTAEPTEPAPPADKDIPKTEGQKPSALPFMLAPIALVGAFTVYAQKRKRAEEI